jgi:hypothetical protein
VPPAARAGDAAREQFVIDLQRSSGNAAVQRVIAGRLLRQPKPGAGATATEADAGRQAAATAEAMSSWVRPEARRGTVVRIEESDEHFGGSTLHVTTKYVVTLHEWDRETSSSALLRVEHAIRFTVPSGAKGEIQVTNAYARFTLDELPSDPTLLVHQLASQAGGGSATIDVRSDELVYRTDESLPQGDKTSLAALLARDPAMAIDVPAEARLRGIGALLDRLKVKAPEESHLDQAETRVEEIEGRVDALIRWLETPPAGMEPNRYEADVVHRYHEVDRGWWAQIENDLQPEKMHLDHLAQTLTLREHADRARELAFRLRDAERRAEETFALELVEAPGVVEQLVVGAGRGTVGLLTGAVEGVIETGKEVYDLGGLLYEWVSQSTPLPDYTHDPASGVGEGAEKGLTSADVVEGIVMAAPRAIDHALTQALEGNFEPAGELLPQALLFLGGAEAEAGKVAEEAGAGRAAVVAGRGRAAATAEGEGAAAAGRAAPHKAPGPVEAGQAAETAKAADAAKAGEGAASAAKPAAGPAASAPGEAGAATKAARQQEATAHLDELRKRPLQRGSMGEAWDHARFPEGPKRRWRPGDPPDMPSARGGYPAWGTIRGRVWRSLAQSELEARAAGAVRDTESLLDFDAVRRMTKSQLEEMVRTGKSPSGFEIEHARIPQRAARMFERAGLPRAEARRLAHLGEPSNLEPAPREWHAVVDEEAAKWKGRNPSLPASIDDRTEFPLGSMRESEAQELLDAIRRHGIDLEETSGGRALREALREENARRGNRWAVP